jgi:hypothetical protein
LICTSPMRFYAQAENKRRCSRDGRASRVSLAAFIFRRRTRRDE